MPQPICSHTGEVSRLSSTIVYRDSIELQIWVQVLAGGKITSPGGAKGDFFAPTVLKGVTPAMRIWKEEVFGPVMVVVPFSNDSEAVSLANDSAFGLGSNVFSRDIRRANAIATKLQVTSVIATSHSRRANTATNTSKRKLSLHASFMGLKEEQASHPIAKSYGYPLLPCEMSQ